VPTLRPIGRGALRDGFLLENVVLTPPKGLPLLVVLAVERGGLGALKCIDGSRRIDVAHQDPAEFKACWR
jgi:hypothetical protein